MDEVMNKMSSLDDYNPRIWPEELSNHALQKIQAHYLMVLSKFFVNENEVSVAKFFNPLRIKLSFSPSKIKNRAVR